MARIAEQLSTGVRAQWEDEASMRRLYGPSPLPVSWAAAAPDLTVEWGSLVNLATSSAGRRSSPPAGTWATDPADLAGKGEELVKVLDRVPTGRVVVLGEPGAGKTMLMIRLVLDLIEHRGDGEPVPILASIASWNPVDQDLRDWLAAQLLRDHPGLANPPPTGRTERTQADALLADHLILPVLDGLDEMPEQIRGPAIDRINDALRPSERLVVTCRSAQYRDAIRPKDGPELRPVEAAAVIELRPLDLAAAHEYLRHGAPGPETRARWDRVFNRLGKKAPVREAFTTPLMVSLAHAVYNSSPAERSTARPDPIELRNRALTDRKAVESLLFDAFIPAAYRRDPADHWKVQDAERWLVFLACHLENEMASTDLAWWQLRRAAAGVVARFWVVVGVVAAFGVVAAWVTSIAAGDGLVAGVLHVAGSVTAAGLVAGVMVRFRPGGRRVTEAPARGMRINVRKLDVTAVFVVLVVVGAVVGFGARAGVPFVVVVVVGLGALTGLEGVPGDPAKSTSPKAVLARDRRTALLYMLASGVVAGVAFGVGAAIVAGAAFGVVTGLVAGVVFGFLFSFSEAAWPSYLLTMGWLAFRHRLPWSLMGFLEDAHKRGVLRQAGAVYQFRHIELQRRLANTSGAIGSYHDVGDADGDKLRVTLVKMVDPSEGADEHAFPDGGKRFVSAVFEIRALSGSPQDEDPKKAAAVIGSNGQTYSADLKDITGYPNFGNGTINLVQGEATAGSVTFQVPEGVNVQKVQWTPGGHGPIVVWKVRR